MDESLFITVHDRVNARVGWVRAPLSVDLTVRHNAPATMTLELDEGDAAGPLLMAPGARVSVDHGNRRLMTGRVTGRTLVRGQGYEFDVVGDFSVLSGILGWPVPAAPLSGQSVAYWTRTGPAETVLKVAVTENARRLGLPVTCAPDLGRGQRITATLRFHPLSDRLVPQIDATGLGITVTAVGQGLVVDVREPVVYPRTLTYESGVVQSVTIEQRDWTVSRVVAGSQGEAEARKFFGPLIDRSREAQNRWVVEQFVDARDTDEPDKVTTRMQEALDEGAATTGLAMTLSSTAAFRLGNGFDVGDVLPVEVIPGQTVTEILREARVTWTADDGLVQTPVTGQMKNVATATAQALGRALRRIRSLETR